MALKVLLQIAKLLQCIANEQIENKITLTANGQDKILAFIEKSIQPIRDYAARLVVHKLSAVCRNSSSKYLIERGRDIFDEEDSRDSSRVGSGQRCRTGGQTHPRQSPSPPKYYRLHLWPGVPNAKLTTGRLYEIAVAVWLELTPPYLSGHQSEAIADSPQKTKNN